MNPTFRVRLLVIFLFLILFGGIYGSSKIVRKQSTSKTGSQQCQDLVHYTWLVKLKEKKIERLSKATSSFKACSDPVVSGVENAKIVLQDSTGKIVYEQKVFIQLNVISESFSGDTIDGTSTLAQETVMNGNIPSNLPDSTKFKLIDLTKNTTLAEGTI